MRTILFFLQISILTGCMQSKTSDTTSQAMNPLAPLLWSGQFPLNMAISGSFSQQEQTQINNMLESWESSDEYVHDFFHPYAVAASAFAGLSPSDHLDETLGIYKYTNWPEEYSPTSLAVTQLYGRRYNRSEADEFVSIQHADIFVNYDDFEFGTTGFNLESVIVHEIGHFLGLSHYAGTDRNESVMYPYLRRSDIKNRPTAYDHESIIARYGLYDQEVSENQDEPGEEIVITIELRADFSETITERRFF